MFKKVKNILTNAVFATLATFTRPITSESSGSISSEPVSMIETLKSSFPVEFYEVLSKYALTIPDVSQSLQKKITLGNTGLTFNLEGASDTENEKGIQEIEKYIDSNPGLINKLIRQVSLYGALSAEAIPSVDLDRLDSIALIPVKKIRFGKNVDDEGKEYIYPYYNTNVGTTRKLNLEQYTYEALETDENSPYAIPPGLSAIKNIEIQQTGTENIKTLFKKWGLFGFISVIKKRTRPRAGQNLQDHEKESEDLLLQLKDRIAKNNTKGYMVAYDDTTVNHTESSKNSKGQESIWKINEEQIASGLNIDPALLGRSYSTTETYAGVVFNSFVKSLANSRHPVKRFLIKAMTLHLRGLGFNFNYISASWGADISHNPKGDAEADKVRQETKQIEINNTMKLVDRGIIDINKAAHLLGFEKAKATQKTGLHILHSNKSKKKT